MRVYELIEMLALLPQNATVHMDDEEYPMVEGCFIPVHEGDPEDAPPDNVVLITVKYKDE